MKSIYCIIAGMLLLLPTLKAQIGIYTENPQSLFHIDALSNNNNTTPAEAQQLDDVYWGLGLNDEAVMSIGQMPVSNTQLLLTDNRKSFLPNKVALTSTLDQTTVPNPQSGMFVYNTERVADVTPGLYVYTQNKWVYIFTETIKRLQIRELQKELVTLMCGALDPDCAETMDFGDDIIIPETGAYSVGFYFTGFHPSLNSDAQREILYVWLLAVDQNGDEKVVDVAELNPISFRDNASTTYTVFMGGKFNAGDRLVSKASTNLAPQYLLRLTPKKTQMVYWKLEQALIM